MADLRCKFRHSHFTLCDMSRVDSPGESLGSDRTDPANACGACSSLDAALDPGAGTVAKTEVFPTVLQLSAYSREQQQEAAHPGVSDTRPEPSVQGTAWGENRRGIHGETGSDLVTCPHRCRQGHAVTPATLTLAGLGIRRDLS